MIFFFFCAGQNATLLVLPKCCQDSTLSDFGKKQHLPRWTVGICCERAQNKKRFEVSDTVVGEHLHVLFDTFSFLHVFGYPSIIGFPHVLVYCFFYLFILFSVEAGVGREALGLVV